HQLVQRFVVIPALGQRVQLARLSLERVGLTQSVGAGLTQFRRRGRRQRLLDLGQGVEVPSALGQRGVGADAAAGKVPYPLLVLAAIRVGVKVARSVIPGTF